MSLYFDNKIYQLLDYEINSALLTTCPYIKKPIPVNPDLNKQKKSQNKRIENNRFKHSNYRKT